MCQTITLENKVRSVIEQSNTLLVILKVRFWHIHHSFYYEWVTIMLLISDCKSKIVHQKKKDFPVTNEKKMQQCPETSCPSKLHFLAVLLKCFHFLVQFVLWKPLLLHDKQYLWANFSGNVILESNERNKYVGTYLSLCYQKYV